MAQSSWLAAVGGFWDEGTKWSTGIPPNGPGADAIINVGPNEVLNKYFVTVAGSDNITLNSLTLDNDSAALNVSGAMSTGSLTLNRGELELSGGTFTTGSADVNSVILGNGTFASPNSFTLQDTAILARSTGGNLNTLTITTNGFVNHGSLAADTADLVLDLSGPFGNLSGGTLSGVDYSAGHSSTLFLPDNADVTTLQATVGLSQSGNIKWRNTQLEIEQSLTDTLTTIGGNGALDLGNSSTSTPGYTYETANTLTDEGSIDLENGAILSPAGLDVTATGALVGSGEVTVSLTNDGDIISSGLKLDGAVTGSGLLEIFSFGSLEIAGATPQNVFFHEGQILNGLAPSTLILHDPLGFTGAVQNFVAKPTAANGGTADTIDLTSVSPTGVSKSYTGDASGGTLTLTQNGNVVAALNFQGNYTADSFDITGDGSTGTAVMLSSTGAATGDVHMVTFDGLHYDMQAVGDFVLTRSTAAANPFEVQVRTAPWPINNTVSVMTEIAARVGSHSLVFGLDGGVKLDGVADAVSAPQALGGGTLMKIIPGEYVVDWSGGERLVIANRGTYLDLNMTLGAADGPGSVQGLLGSDSGAASEFQLPDGTVLQQTGSAIPAGFADSWRVTQAQSMLGAPPSQGGGSGGTVDPPPPDGAISYTDVTANTSGTSPAQAYAGGVDYLHYQYITPAPTRSRSAPTRRTPISVPARTAARCRRPPATTCWSAAPGRTSWLAPLAAMAGTTRSWSISATASPGTQS